MFAERLKRAMEYRRKTITDVAENCGLSKGLLSNYLSGKFNAKQKNIYIIAKYLDVSPSFLLGATDNMVIPSIKVINNLRIDEEHENSISYQKNETIMSLVSEIHSICTWQDEETLRTILTLVKSLDNRNRK